MGDLPKDTDVRLGPVQFDPYFLVFQRFWRGDRRHAGAGLGLAITRSIMDACGGRIEIDDADGGGARHAGFSGLASRYANAGAPAIASARRYFTHPPRRG